MEFDNIIIRGAREHNLKNVDLDLPRGKLIVFTGVSGSGKSSLAFDTLYAEGQRRYVESLSSYARQFLGQLEKPHFRSIKGLSPTIAIQQSRPSHNPRSTVGTITEVLDFLRVLYARIGRQHCPKCDTEIIRQSAQDIVHSLLQLHPGTRFSLLAPVESAKTDFHKALQEVRQQGFVRVRVDGAIHSLDELPVLDMRTDHRLDIIVDRLIQKEGLQQRLTDSVETTLKYGDGRCILLTTDGLERLFTEHMACPACDTPVPEKTPQLFSFNHPQGMCPECEGLGTRLEPDPAKLVPDPSLSIADGAIKLWSRVFHRADGPTYKMLKAALDLLEIDPKAPFDNLTDEQQRKLLYGAEGLHIDVSWESRRGKSNIQAEYEAVVPLIMRRLRETKSEGARRYYLDFLSEAPCTACNGQRLRQEALSVRVGELSIADLQDLSLQESLHRIESLELCGTDSLIADELLKETQSRLRFLLNVGLGYLSLSRQAPTLSGGELQRIRLASQIGSELTGVLYVLDEPSIGLHARDNARLLRTLKQLRDLGNTVLVVEHDRETIQSADHVVDFGPGAGHHGGEILFTGAVEALSATLESRTGGYLSGRLEIEIPAKRRPATSKKLKIIGAAENNLKNIDVAIPLQCFVAVTGVSGAGKSTLLNEILYPALASRIHRADKVPGRFQRLEGIEQIDKVIYINQAPIGRSPRSTPATYVHALEPIRRLFAQLPEARVRGYSANRFSFNARGGRCEACQGEGLRRIEMHFLADLYVSCEVCHGHRFNEATLEIKYKDWSIADVLEHTVDEAYELFRNHRKIAKILYTLIEVGLGYIHLGQTATTLSGGEAQRIKLAKELARADTGRTLYLLDEPTTGLHFDDIRRLLEVLDRLVNAGNSVMVIEHNLDVIKRADHIIDMGPEGGERGGRVVVAGSPEQVAETPGSFTGQALRDELGFPP